MTVPSGREAFSSRRVNLLVYVTGKIGPQSLPYLVQKADLNLRVVCDCSKDEFQQMVDADVSLKQVQWHENSPQDPYRNQTQMLGHRLARWADLLFVIVDASMVSLMLAGYTTDIILHVLRCWDTSKRIVMLPELSVDQWKHPIWRRQLSKLQRKWDWVHVLQPALWDLAQAGLDPDSHIASASGQETVEDLDLDLVWSWQGPEEILEAIHSEDLAVLRRTQLDALSSRWRPRRLAHGSAQNRKARLPPEIWTQILDNLGDWELATALGIFTHLPVPHEWKQSVPRPGVKSKTLEYTILTCPLSKIRTYFQNSATYQPPSTLSPLATKLIFRFSMTQLLNYLALHQKDIFWTSFGLALLPHKASLIYNSPAILQWWKDCPAVIKKQYGPEALDGASRAGFVEVLDWWLNSGLSLSYTEKALESASAKGHVESGRTESIAWWEASGIPYSHEDGVTRLASQHGHVKVLELWHSFKGSKMIFDNQVLVGATKNGHAGVLQWWKDVSAKYGLRVEYKTCDIEEAMEDAVGGGGESEVREWWGRNGLNLGIGTGEWMKVKTL
ncbi:hypothetical protein DV736_g4944, partial [Chaetothyriales sp. CBS 134916]